jgi:methionyl-tRNA formyltransferase
VRVILAGQKSFGLAAYDAILGTGHSVAEVWSPADLPVGKPFADWSDKLTRAAGRDGVWTPPMMRTPERVAELEVDLFVAAHSHDFISRPARAATRLGGVGYHPSLLPRHRGRDAVRWTVHMGDPIAGGSVYWLTDNVDGGPIAAQDWCFVPRPYADRYDMVSSEDQLVSALWRQSLFPMGVRLLIQVLNDLQLGVMVEVPQEEEFATWEPSWERPPLHRPDLPQLGAINGFQHVTTRNRRG